MTIQSIVEFLCRCISVQAPGEAQEILQEGDVNTVPPEFMAHIHFRMGLQLRHVFIECIIAGPPLARSTPSLRSGDLPSVGPPRFAPGPRSLGESFVSHSRLFLCPSPG